MTDFSKIVTSVPVSRQAARQMGKGVAWTPRAQLQNTLPDCPPLRPVPVNPKDPNLVNLTGAWNGGYGRRSGPVAGKSLRADPRQPPTDEARPSPNLGPVREGGGA